MMCVQANAHSGWSVLLTTGRPDKVGKRKHQHDLQLTVPLQPEAPQPQAQAQVKQPLRTAGDVAISTVGSR